MFDDSQQASLLLIGVPLVFSIRAGGVSCVPSDMVDFASAGVTRVTP